MKKAAGTLMFGYVIGFAGGAACALISCAFVAKATLTAINYVEKAERKRRPRHLTVVAKETGVLKD